MSAQKVSPAPKGIGGGWRRLWRAVLGDYELDEHERLVLIQACRTVDLLDRLAQTASGANLTVTNARGDAVANPAVVEHRQQSITLIRLLASLRLPSGDEADLTRPQRRGGARGSYGIRAVR